MRRSGILIALALAILGVSSCDRDSGPTRPTDRNLALYGSYVGSLDYIYEGNRHLEPCLMAFGRDSIHVESDGVCCPVDLVYLSDPNVAFVAVWGGMPTSFAGTRVGDVVAGTFEVPGAIEGTFRVER
jgi:hypothetical protein